MRQGHISKHDLERIIDGVEHEMIITPLEKPRVRVNDLDSDSDDAHVVNLDELSCTCPDYEYNCTEREYCKHIYAVVFKKHGMI